MDPKGKEPHEEGPSEGRPIQGSSDPHFDADDQLNAAAADRIWGRICDAIDQSEQESAHELVGVGQIESLVETLEFTPSGAGWIQTGIAGLRVKVVRDDPEADRRTTLLELAPGCSFPMHSHHGPEECYVITGDLSTAECTLNAGDYRRMPAKSEHGMQRTEKGCVVVIVASRLDGLPSS